MARTKGAKNKIPARGNDGMKVISFRVSDSVYELLRKFGKQIEGDDGTGLTPTEAARKLMKKALDEWGCGKKKGQ